MFADSLLETSWTYRGRRSWTTLTSFGVQAVVIGLLLMIPVLTTVGVPLNPHITTPVSWGAPPPPTPPTHRERLTTLVQSNISNNTLIAPPTIPDQVRIINETEAPPQVNYDDGGGVLGSTGAGDSRDGVWNSIRNSIANVQPPPPPPTIKRQFKTSSMLEGSLIRKLQPIYPPLARSARIQGSVVLAAVIGKDGTMENLKLISGHPMLVQSAVQAVSQWRYRPYILNGEAIEVETQITVNFILGN